MEFPQKTYIALGLALLVVGFLLGRVVSIPAVDSVAKSIREQVETVVPVPSADTVKENITPEETKAPVVSPSAPIKIDSTVLTAPQKAMLESFGIDTSTLTVTATMISCAKEKLGEARFAEIAGGATPSFIEGASLISCYKK